jgi:hypothetical protein
MFARRLLKLAFPRNTKNILNRIPESLKMHLPILRYKNLPCVAEIQVEAQELLKRMQRPLTISLRISFARGPPSPSPLITNHLNWSLGRLADWALKRELRNTGASIAVRLFNKRA